MAKRFRGTLIAKGAYKEHRHIQMPEGRFYGLPLPQSMRNPLEPEVLTDLDEAARHRERNQSSQKRRGVQ